MTSNQFKTFYKEVQGTDFLLDIKNATKFYVFTFEGLVLESFLKKLCRYNSTFIITTNYNLEDPNNPTLIKLKLNKDNPDLTQIPIYVYVKKRRGFSLF